MKKIILTLIIFTAIISISNAQKRLEFNQIISEDSVLTYTVNARSGYVTLHSQTLKVPQGKTWKIQFLSTSGSNDRWHINNTEIYTFFSYSAENITNFTSQSIWLKEGDEIKCSWRAENNSYHDLTTDRHFYLSAIEFNIVEQ